LARWTRIDATLLRVGLVFLALSGFGLIGYLVAWLVIPLEGDSGSVGARAMTDRKGMISVVAFLPVLVAVLVITSALRAGLLSSFAWFGYFTGAGLILIYRNASDDERGWLRRSFDPVFDLGKGSRWSFVLRMVAGLGLLGGGLYMLIRGRSNAAALVPLGAVAMLIAAIVLVFGPWWFRLTRDLVWERQARVRAEVRADMAARVHDSVLQTLALIQRSSADPDRVVQLARTQERDLRSWLFGGRQPGTTDADDEMTLAVAVEELAREVEEAHGVPIDVVAVGDCRLDDELRAMLAAGREATVNSAKWSGAPAVSLFTEVGRKKVSMFVRDRGSGFDPDTVPDDRQGIATSIRGRMDRVGGKVTIRSTLGEGSEIELSVPRQKGRP
jgi:signal transduction histidine kinase